MAAEGRHLAHLLHPLPNRLLSRIEVVQAEEGAAAATLAVRSVLAGRNAAGAALVLPGDEGAVLHVDDEVVTLGNAVLARADFLTGIACLAVLRAEGAAAVDTEPDRGPFAGGKLAEKAFLNLAVLSVYVWHFVNALISAFLMSKFR
jgi:hypothetical protein